MIATPASLVRLAERINHSTLRERALMFGVAMVVLCTAWQVLLMDPVNARERAAREAMAALDQSNDPLTQAAAMADPAANPMLQALQRERALRAALAAADSELGQASQGFVEPARMADVVRAVLARQSGLVLVSLKSLPVETVLPVAQGQEPQGPYVHPLEIVVDGSYPQIVQYLQTLETLPWRLHWRGVELESRVYPTNRVRIEIATLSMSREWLRV